MLICIDQSEARKFCVDQSEAWKSSTRCRLPRGTEYLFPCRLRPGTIPVVGRLPWTPEPEMRGRRASTRSSGSTRPNRPPVDQPRMVVPRSYRTWDWKSPGCLGPPRARCRVVIHFPQKRVPQTRRLSPV